MDDSVKVIDYEKAWKGLREKATSGWEWLKRQIMPVDASQYRMRSNLTEDEIKTLMKEGPIKGPKYIELLNRQSAEDWTIPSKKKGGKVKKCRPGNVLSQLSTTDIFGNTTVSPNFKFTTQMPHSESSIEHATKGVLENSN